MNNLPEHIAIIMDGNRRWAKEHNVPIQMGHKEGAKTIEKIVQYANQIGLKYITLTPSDLIYSNFFFTPKRFPP